MELNECIHCGVCRMLFNGPDQYDDHLRGKHHRKKRRRQRSQALAVLGNDDDDHAPKKRVVKLDRTGCLAGLSNSCFRQTRGPPTDASSACACRAMSDGSRGALGRHCSHDVTGRMTNVSVGGREATSEFPCSFTPPHAVSACTADTRASCRCGRRVSALERMKPRRWRHRAVAQHPSTRVDAGGSVPAGAVQGLSRQESVFRDMSHATQRAAIYAGIWKDGKFTVPLRDAVLYARAVEHERRQRGHFPRKLTLQIVMEWAAQAASSANWFGTAVDGLAAPGAPACPAPTAPAR